MNEIEFIANSNDTKILQKLGLDINYDGSVKCACPIHDGNNPGAFTYDPSMKRWRCWTHNCHSKYGTGLIGLVRAFKECSIDEACQFIKDLCVNNTNVSFDETEVYIQNQNRKLMRYTDTTYHQSVIDNLKKLDHKVLYFIERGMSEEILTEFDAFLCLQKNHPLKDRACLPIYNIHDQLVGFGGRATSKLVTERKWLYYPSGIKLGQNLFGIHLAKNFIKASHEAIIVEGPGDVLKMHQAGIKNTISSFSNKITHDQIKILMSLGVTKLTVAFDSDQAGFDGYKQIVKEAKMYFHIERKSFPENKDPCDLSCEELKVIFNEN